MPISNFVEVNSRGERGVGGTVFSIAINEEGDAERLALGINGTMRAAQDIVHGYRSSSLGPWCRVCGLRPSYVKHWSYYYRANPKSE